MVVLGGEGAPERGVGGFHTPTADCGTMMITRLARVARPVRAGRWLSAVAEDADAGGEAPKVKTAVPRADRAAYGRDLKKVRGAWRAAALAELADTAAEAEAALVERDEAKRVKRAARAEVAAVNVAAQERARDAAIVARRGRIADAVARGVAPRAARLARQATLVAALEAESASWLVDDAAIDAAINEDLFESPKSTGLVTAESHFYWRYGAEMDQLGRPPFSDEDAALLGDDSPEAAERSRRATTTERLIRTQAAHLAEYHDILGDAADISVAIEDLEVQVMKPRPFVKRKPQAKK